MRRLLLAIILVLISVGAVSADIVPWLVIRTSHFLVYYAPGADSTAKRAGKIAEDSYRMLSRKLGFSPGEATFIYLYPDRVTFSQATGVGRADTIVGMSHAHTFKVDVDASGAFTSVESVIPHELVHVFISHKLKGSFVDLPLWMHEGLAKYLVNDWSPEDAELLSDAASSGGIVPLDSISRVFPADAHDRSVAYVESYSIVKYIADKFGEQTLPYILTNVESGQGFETALHYSLGTNQQGIEDEWRQYLWNKYGLSRTIKFISGAISAVMGILAILAFRARIIQKRKKATQMEEEASEESSLIDGEMER